MSETHEIEKQLRELFGPKTVSERRKRVLAVITENVALKRKLGGIDQDAKWARDCLTQAGFVAGRSTAAPDRALAYIEHIIERSAAEGPTG